VRPAGAVERAGVPVPVPRTENQGDPMSDKKKPSKKKKAPVEIGETFKKALPVNIDEKMAHAKEGTIRALLTKNVLLKEKAKPFNDERKLNSERIEKLRKEVESLTEEREVKCRLEYDYPHRQVHTRRLDTNAIVKDLTRTMEDADRQEPLIGERKPAKQRKAKVIAFQSVVDASDAQPEIGGEA
jgi:hypothetical protein